jgi:quinol monooxygenase YgiN
MAVRLVVTFTAQPGRAADFVEAWRDRVAEVRREPGCEQYELFQSLDDPDRVVILERWASQALLERHMQAERTGDSSVIDALVALWAPGTTPTIERYEVD